MRLIIFLSVIALSFLVINEDLISEENYIRVFYKDKGPDEFFLGSDLYVQTLNTLTPRAIKRRMKVRDTSNIITYEDAPVYEPYIAKIEKLGAKSIHHLKWRNYSVFRCELKLINKIKNLKFVKSVQLTSQKTPVFWTDSNDIPKGRTFKLNSIFNVENKETLVEKYYGNSYIQNSLIGTDKLHALGITGDSVLIAFMDSGFNWRTHDALSNANVIFERDFIQLDSNTSNEKDDTDGQDGHGTLCFSTVSGIYNGELIGTSPSSSFILCKTESIHQEIHLEEDNYAAAMEWIESLGTDISSSSLAYYNFDEFENSYLYQELNGNTSISAIAVNNAVARGMICVTAAGNNGPQSRTLFTPADADSAIAVGAVQITPAGLITAGFSSRGPRGDSIIKPDIAALGVKVACTTPKTKDKFMTANGTSVATPLVAGSIGLMLSCFPELTPYQIRELLYSTAINNQSKNNSIGYGVLNIFDAMKKAGTIISSPAIYNIKSHLRILFHIVPKGLMMSNPMLICDINSSINKFELRKLKEEYQYVCDIPLELIKDFTCKAYLTVSTKEDSRRYPYDSSNFFYFSRETRIIPFGIFENSLPSSNLINSYSINSTILKENKETIKIEFELGKPSQVHIFVTSSNGNTIYRKTVDYTFSGIVDLDIPIANYSSGIYAVNITTNYGMFKSNLLIY